MEKLSFLGVGPKIARIAIPFLVIAIVLTVLFPGIFTFGTSAEKPLLFAGIILLAIAIVFYISTLSVLVPGIRGNRLVTGGVYRLCQNPLYAALLLFLIPGLGLVLNSWIIPLTSLLGSLAFRKYIHEEEDLLERLFGDEFRQYRDKTSFFFPNPFKK
jgi:protein-S-isoprenylcysteine O-methyltransferase Ste14